jgi:hypothetical protein
MTGKKFRAVNEEKNGRKKVCGRKERMAGTIKKNFEAGMKSRSK